MSHSLVWSFALSVAVVACSPTSPELPSDAGLAPLGPTAPPASGAPTGPPPTALRDGGDAFDAADSAPGPLPPFELVVGGEARRAVRVTTEQVRTDGARPCRRRIDVEATLEAIGRERADVPPRLTLSLCAADLPGPRVVPFDADSKEGAELRFTVQYPGAVHFPLAVGPGLNVVRDGSEGWFEASASGTFELARGIHEPFSLRFRQAVASFEP